MYKYENIIKDGEVSCDTMIRVLDKMGYVDNLEVKVSNGMSFVFISSEINNVYQYYVGTHTTKNIFNIINKIWQNKIIRINFYFGTFQYNLYEYISKFVSYIPDNIIVWKKHLCINSFDKDKIEKIINDNIFKLLWDISKCLYGLHQNNISHGDVRIDNIGISNNNFILFDFDGSNIFEPDYDYSKDVSDFLRSIQFNSDTNWKNIKKYVPGTSSSFSFISKIIQNYSKFKSRLSYYQIINELNQLQIKL